MCFNCIIVLIMFIVLWFLGKELFIMQRDIETVPPFEQEYIMVGPLTRGEF